MTSDAIYCFDRASVLFAIHPEGDGGPRVVAETTEDTLRDIFGAQGGGDGLVFAWREHADRIEEAAMRHSRRDPEPVALQTVDFELPRSLATDSVN